MILVEGVVREGGVGVGGVGIGDVSVGGGNVSQWKWLNVSFVGRRCFLFLRTVPVGVLTL